MPNDDGETFSCACSLGANCDNRAAKHPACAHGHKDATTDEAVLRSFFEHARYRNVGLATGQVSNLAVIDIDPRNGGAEAWQEYCAMFPSMRTDTYTVATGNGGLHLYFTIPQGEQVDSVNGLLLGVDLKADKGYVVAPPSTHISGEQYRTVSPVDLLPLPEPILAMLRSGQRPAGLTRTPAGPIQAQGMTSARQREIMADPSALREGERDIFFTFTARDLVRAGRSPQECLDELGRVFDLMPDKHGFSITDVADKIQRALNYVPEDERRNPQLTAWFDLIHNQISSTGTPATEPPSAEEAGPEPAIYGSSDDVPVLGEVVDDPFPPFPEQPGTGTELVPGMQPTMVELYEATRRELPGEVMHHWQGELPDNWEASARGLADLANLQYGELIRFVRDTEDWLLWRPKELRWQSDASIEIRGLIQGTIDSLKLVALATEDDEDRNNLLGFSRSMSWPHSINSVLTTLQTDHVIDQRHLNNRTQALPLENGIIDPTFVGDSYDDVPVYPLEPQWLFTKSTKLRHEHSAYSLKVAAFWKRSLERWFPDPAVREFAQRLMGYAVFGRGQEKVFVIAHGARDSGKSAFFNNLAFLLDDFAVQISPESLIATRYENEAQYGLAHIAGARLYVSSELKANTHLNSALIKRLSSGGSDTVRARQMRQDFIEIVPQGLLCIMTNYIPQEDQLDDALWGRTVILPFMGNFPADDPETVKDAQLQQLLIANRAGILEWLVTGYANYTAKGLRRPSAIDELVREVKDEQDWGSPYLDTWIEVADDERLLCRDAWLAYEVWCRDTGDEPVTRQKFNLAMRDRLGQSRRGTGGQRYYHGVKLKRPLDTMPAGWNP